MLRGPRAPSHTQKEIWEVWELKVRERRDWVGEGTVLVAFGREEETLLLWGSWAAAFLRHRDPRAEPGGGC